MSGSVISDSQENIIGATEQYQESVEKAFWTTATFDDLFVVTVVAKYGQSWPSVSSLLAPYKGKCSRASSCFQPFMGCIAGVMGSECVSVANNDEIGKSAAWMGTQAAD